MKLLGEYPCKFDGDVDECVVLGDVTDHQRERATRKSTNGAGYARQCRVAEVDSDLDLSSVYVDGMRRPRPVDDFTPRGVILSQTASAQCQSLEDWKASS